MMPTLFPTCSSAFQFKLKYQCKYNDFQTEYKFL